MSDEPPGEHASSELPQALKAMVDVPEPGHPIQLWSGTVWRREPDSPSRVSDTVS